MFDVCVKHYLRYDRMCESTVHHYSVSNTFDTEDMPLCMSPSGYSLTAVSVYYRCSIKISACAPAVHFALIEDRTITVSRHCPVTMTVVGVVTAVHTI
jgi:hypothetical protein